MSDPPSGSGSSPGSALALDRRSIAEAARVRSPWSVREERNVPIYVARNQRMTLQQLWPRLAGEN